MAKVYKFQVTLYKATFTPEGTVQVVLSDMFPGKELSKTVFEGTLEQAVAKRNEVSAAEQRPHAAILDIVDAKGQGKPRGYGAVTKTIYGGEGSK